MEQPTNQRRLETDEYLIGQYAQGDRNALDVLFSRHRDAAYRVAYRLLNNQDDALDAVQEGFIKTLRRLTGFEQRSSFKTWLLRVVSNTALDLGRARRRREALNQSARDLVAEGSIEPVYWNNPVAMAEVSDLRSALAQALAALPESQRATFVLHVDGELSYREIAQMMGISIGTVMSRLFYARQKLKTLLGDRVSS
jgi:RNA polymerase sigma-70 factor, ECF subfamily